MLTLISFLYLRFFPLLSASPATCLTEPHSIVLTKMPQKNILPQPMLSTKC